MFYANNSIYQVLASVCAATCKFISTQEIYQVSVYMHRFSLVSSLPCSYNFPYASVLAEYRVQEQWRKRGIMRAKSGERKKVEDRFDKWASTVSESNNLSFFYLA